MNVSSTSNNFNINDAPILIPDIQIMDESAGPLPVEMGSFLIRQIIQGVAESPHLQQSLPAILQPSIDQFNNKIDQMNQISQQVNINVAEVKQMRATVEQEVQALQSLASSVQNKLQSVSESQVQIERTATQVKLIEEQAHLALDDINIHKNSIKESVVQVTQTHDRVVAMINHNEKDCKEQIQGFLDFVTKFQQQMDGFKATLVEFEHQLKQMGLPIVQDQKFVTILDGLVVDDNKFQSAVSRLILDQTEQFRCRLESMANSIKRNPEVHHNHSIPISASSTTSVNVSTVAHVHARANIDDGDKPTPSSSSSSNSSSHTTFPLVSTNKLKRAALDSPTHQFQKPKPQVPGNVNFTQSSQKRKLGNTSYDDQPNTSTSSNTHAQVSQTPKNMVKNRNNVGSNNSNNSNNDNDNDNDNKSKSNKSNKSNSVKNKPSVKVVHKPATIIPQQTSEAELLHSVVDAMFYLQVGSEIVVYYAEIVAYYGSTAHRQKVLVHVIPTTVEHWKTWTDNKGNRKMSPITSTFKVSDDHQYMKTIYPQFDYLYVHHDETQGYCIYNPPVGVSRKDVVGGGVPLFARALKEDTVLPYLAPCPEGYANRQQTIMLLSGGKGLKATNQTENNHTSTYHDHIPPSKKQKVRQENEQEQDQHNQDVEQDQPNQDVEQDQPNEEVEQ